MKRSKERLFIRTQTHKSSLHRFVRKADLYSTCYYLARHDNYTVITVQRLICIQSVIIWWVMTIIPWLRSKGWFVFSVLLSGRDNNAVITQCPEIADKYNCPGWQGVKTTPTTTTTKQVPSCPANRIECLFFFFFFLLFFFFFCLFPLSFSVLFLARSDHKELTAR